MRFFPLFFLISFSLFAYDLEEEMGPVSTKTDSGKFGAGFTSREFEKGWVGFQLFESTLYWHAKVGGTDYVYDLATRKKGKAETRKFDWDWGYRIGAGVSLPIVKWEIIGTYTHFGTQDHGGKRVIPASPLISLKEGVISSTQDARSDYKIDYDNIEFSLHQSSFFSRLLGSATAIGVKKTWIDQKQGVTYQGDVATKVEDRCRFVGVGPMIGLNMKWPLLYGISCIAETKGAFLFGNFEVQHSENETAFKGDTHLFTPTLHFLLGLQWDVPMKWMQFSLSLGYEAEYFWRQNRSVEIKNNVSNYFQVQLIRYAEDLTFYGGTLRAGLEF